MDMVRGAVPARRAENEFKLQLESFEILLIDYVRQKNAHVILRGLRALSDFGTNSSWRSPTGAWRPISKPSPRPARACVPARHAGQGVARHGETSVPSAQ